MSHKVSVHIIYTAEEAAFIRALMTLALKEHGGSTVLEVYDREQASGVMLALTTARDEIILTLPRYEFLSEKLRLELVYRKIEITDEARLRIVEAIAL